MSLFNLGSSDEVEYVLWRSSRLLITSSIDAGTGSSYSMCGPGRIWSDVVLSRTVLKIFLWQYFGREHLLRAASNSCLCPVILL